MIELEPTDASTLAIMNWSFDNFPEGKGPEGRGRQGRGVFGG